MPIDFATIAKRFADIAFQDRLANTAGQAVQRLAEKRLAAVRAAEMNTRDIPTLQFEDGAVAVYVMPPSGGPDIASEAFGPSPTTTATLGGWARWLNAATDLPDFIDAVDRVLAAVEESIDRYVNTPTPDLFDPSRRTIFDVFGVGAAFSSALSVANKPDGTLDQLCKQLKESIAILRPAPSAAPAAAGGVAAAAAGAMADSALSAAGISEPVVLDDPDSITLAGALTLLALPELIAIALAAVDIRARLLALDALEKAENGVRNVIAGIYQKVFSTLRDRVLEVLRLVAAIADAVGAFVSSAAKLAVGVGTGFAAAIRDFVYQLARFMQAVIVLMTLVVELLATLGLESDHPKAPKLDLKLDFPGFGETTLFGGDTRRRVDEILRNADDGMQTAVTDGIGRAANELQRGARDVTAQMPSALTVEALPPRLPADAEALAATILPTEHTRAQHDPLAQTFESWIGAPETWIGTTESLVAGGGIGVLIAVMHGYAREVAQLWHARETDDPATGVLVPGSPAPTSPHKLRRHAYPHRVQVPRMIVRVGTKTDSAVLDEIASQFAGAVRDAYREGTQRLNTAAGR